MPVKSLDTAPLPFLGVPQIDQATQVSHVGRGLKLVPCRLSLVAGSDSVSSYEPVSCFCGFSCDVLDPPGSYDSYFLSSAGFSEF